MAKKFPTAEELLVKNPHLDHGEYERIERIMNELSKYGLRQKGYQLPPPFAKHRLSVTYDDQTICLTRPKK